jgi:8-oxo-dGTP diphosphatase
MACAIDAVCFMAGRRELGVLLARADRGAWRLPSAEWEPGPDMDHSAAGLIRQLFGRDATWREQFGAYGATSSSTPALSVGYVAVFPRETAAPPGAEWHALAKLPAGLAQRQRGAVAAAMAWVNARMDFVPVAFKLLPAAFTLSELQEMYELLLGRKLHKASFRRALQAAHLVEPTDEWQSEGRGRPAQFYRYAPRRRRTVKRIVRFELLGA